MNKKQKASKSKGTQTIEFNRDDNLIQRRSFIAAAASTLPVALVACKTGDQLSTLETTDKALQTATSLALNEESASSSIMTTFGPAGEEGGGSNVTTEAVGEEGGAQITTFGPASEEGGGPGPGAVTEAIGEDGGAQITTFGPASEEGGGPGPRAVTEAIGEDGGRPNVTTQAVGEEGGRRPGITTQAIGEEGGRGPVTQAVGEQGGRRPGVITTQAVGEEGAGPGAITQAIEEEGSDDVMITTFGPASEEAGSDEKNRITTFGPAGEESGNGRFTTENLEEEGGLGQLVTTMAVGEEAASNYHSNPQVMSWTMISRAFTKVNSIWAGKNCDVTVQLISVSLNEVTRSNTMKFTIKYLLGSKKGLSNAELMIEQTASETPAKTRTKLVKRLTDRHADLCK